MNNNFNLLREKYPTIKYSKYDFKTFNDKLIITYTFEIPNLTTFNPSIQIPLKNQTISLTDPLLNNLIFHIGVVELISYFKCTCSPNIIIEAGYLNEEQIKWFKKLYYLGLGEFLYVNDIKITDDELLNIKCTAKKQTFSIPKYEGFGNLIPIGGGKDSCVTLELLKDFQKDNNCFIINPKPVMIECTKIANYSEDQCIFVNRTIDKNLIELNKKGFLNGHTPFSAIVAFTSFLTAYIHKKRYITLSNEASANESTVLGTKINHQYSKTYEFENDFNYYTKKYFGINISYFSILRPLNEFQIAKLFSQYEKYHQTFKSCNVGSKEEIWHWCCECPKCLFVFSILSPYLYKEKLVNIFTEDLFEKKELLSTFLELLGYSKNKPFECVGTYSEVRYAISLTIKHQTEKLPFLLQYYKENFPLELEHNFENSFNNEHNLPKKYEEIIKKEIKK